MFISANSHTRFWWLGVFSIVTLSAILSFQAVLQTNIDTPIRGDARDYVGYAFNLKIHGIYSKSWPETATDIPAADALRAPGYPVLLTLFVDTEDNTIAIAKVLLLQGMLNVLTVVTYLLLFRRFMPTGWALAAGLMTSISPHLINASVYLLSESLFSFMLGAHLLVLERAIRQRNIYWALLAGTLLTLSFLVRPTTQYLILVYLAIAILGFRSITRQHWKILACLLFPVLLSAGTWATRNIIETGRPSDPTLSANFLQHGMYINMMYEDRPESYGYPYRFDPANAEIAGNTGKILEAIGQRFIDEPNRYLAWLLIGKPIQFFSWNLTESVGDAFIFAPIYSPYFDRQLFNVTHTIAKALHPLLMFLGLAGSFLAMFYAKDKNLTACLLSILMLYFVGLHMIGAPFPRYSIPLRPISYGLACLSLHAAIQWAGGKWKELK